MKKQIPIKVLNERLTKLVKIVRERKGGKIYNFTHKVTKKPGEFPK